MSGGISDEKIVIPVLLTIAGVAFGICIGLARLGYILITGNHVGLVMTFFGCLLFSVTTFAHRLTKRRSRLAFVVVNTILMLCVVWTLWLATARQGMSLAWIVCAVHADPNSCRLERVDPFPAGKLRSPVRVENLRSAISVQCLLQRFDAEVWRHRVR